MINTDSHLHAFGQFAKYDFEEALKFVEFTIWNSIVEHEKVEAPPSVIAELKEAHEHIVMVKYILNRRYE